MCGVAMTCGSFASRHSARWLTFEHVEAGAGDMPRLDRIGQRRLVDQLAAGRVHDPDTRLAPCQPGGIEQVAGFRRRRQVQA